MLVIEAIGRLNEGKAGESSVRYIGEVLADGSNVSRVDAKRIRFIATACSDETVGAAQTPFVAGTYRY